jgi:hypothetical protein
MLKANVCLFMPGRERQPVNPQTQASSSTAKSFAANRWWIGEFFIMPEAEWFIALLVVEPP